jgi:hypothetical protein
MPINTKMFLLNLAQPGLVTSNEFKVDTHAVRLFAGGLAGGDTIQLQQYAGDLKAGTGAWQNVARDGNLVNLTAINSQIIEIIGGQYRVTYGGSTSTLVCWMEEEFQDLGTLVRYNFNQPQMSGGGAGITGATGPTGGVGPTGATGPTGADGTGVAFQGLPDGFTGDFTVTGTSTAPIVNTVMSGTGGARNYILPSSAADLCLFTFISRRTANGPDTISPAVGDFINGVGTPFAITNGDSVQLINDTASGNAGWFTV